MEELNFESCEFCESCYKYPLNWDCSRAVKEQERHEWTIEYQDEIESCGSDSEFWKN